MHAPTSAPTCWIALLLCACSAAGRSEAGVKRGDAGHHHHPVLAPSCVLDLGIGKPGVFAESTAATQSPPASRVPIGATVFFRNADANHFVQLAVTGDFQCCAGCVTVTNFTCLKSGALATAIEPGGMSTLCFHNPGRYPFRVTGGEQTLTGYLEVFDPSRVAAAGAK